MTTKEKLDTAEKSVCSATYITDKTLDSYDLEHLANRMSREFLTALHHFRDSLNSKKTGLDFSLPVDILVDHPIKVEFFTNEDKKRLEVVFTTKTTKREAVDK